MASCSGVGLKGGGESKSERRLVLIEFFSRDTRLSAQVDEKPLPIDWPYMSSCFHLTIIVVYVYIC
jgi:hypothetical protein